VLPDTHYVKAGDAHIAYQVVGAGPPDMVYIGSWFSHLDVRWEWPGLADMLHRLASFTRLLLFDKRGTGASDPLPLASLPTLEDWMDDVRLVMDAAGSQEAVLYGSTEGGPMAMLFAATYPERTSALVLANTTARVMPGSDYPWGLSPEVDLLIRQWGRESALDVAAPSVARDERFRAWMAKYERVSATPGAAAALWTMIADLDVRAVLPTIRVPTLVLHTAGNQAFPVGNGRYLAERITGAKFIELPGIDHLPWAGDSRPLVDEIEEFLTGVRRPAEVMLPDRLLLTILFTDIVASTELAAEIGDRRWGELMRNHAEVAAWHIDRFRGRLVQSTGDGFLVTFDGPVRAIHCALAMRAAFGDLGLEIRAGIHTGEVETAGDGVVGIALHIAARVTALAGPGQVLVSTTVKDLVAGCGICFRDLGDHTLKGIVAPWRLFEVTP